MSYPATAVPSGGNYPAAYTRASLLTTEPSQARSGGTKNGFLFLWCPEVRGREPQVQGHVKRSGVQGYNLGPHSYTPVLCVAVPCVLAPNNNMLPKESPTPQVAGHALSEFVKRYVCGHCFVGVTLPYQVHRDLLQKLTTRRSPGVILGGRSADMGL